MLEELRGLHQRWNKEVPALLENEEGRYIAANQQDVTTFRSHFDTLEKLPESALDSMTAELDALLAPVESALEDKTVADLPDERLSTQLAALDSRLQEALAPYKLAISAVESITANARKRGELGIWQRRFWQHTVRDESDLKRCVDYIHWNPRKHTIVDRVRDWEYSTFHRFVSRGEYGIDWGGEDPTPGYEAPEWGE